MLWYSNEAKHVNKNHMCFLLVSSKKKKKNMPPDVSSLNQMGDDMIQKVKAKASKSLGIHIDEHLSSSDWYKESTLDIRLT